MKQKTSGRFEVGGFLDPDSGDSSVVGYVKDPYIDSDHHDSTQYVGGRAMLRLSDCSRSIEWDFVFYRNSHDRSYYNVAKMNTLIGFLEEMRDYMEACNVEMVHLQDKVDKHNKKLRKNDKA